MIINCIECDVCFNRSWKIRSNVYISHLNLSKTLYVKRLKTANGRHRWPICLWIITYRHVCKSAQSASIDMALTFPGRFRWDSQRASAATAPDAPSPPSCAPTVHPASASPVRETAFASRFVSNKRTYTSVTQHSWSSTGFVYENTA